MSETVVRKTASATFVIENFSQMTSSNHVYFTINGFSNNVRFGINPKTVAYTYGDENVSVFLLSSNKFKYIANVSILNSQKDKLFTTEYTGELGNKTNLNYFCLMPHSQLLSPINGYLYYDKLTLLCELEVLEDEENQKTESISKDLNNLSENLQSLLIDGKFTDAVLVVGKNGKEFRVHKAILSARSSVFAAMFEHDCEEKRQNKVNIKDMDEEVCAEMMSYIYTGKVKDLDRYAMELLEVGDKYQLHSLKSICTEYMCNYLSVESVANVLILSDLHQATDLKTKCIEFISANVGQAQTTDGWKVLGKNGTLLQEIIIYLAKKK